MSTIVGHTTRAAGTILTAAIYNADHTVHITNANELNNSKLEGGTPPVVDGHAVVWDGTDAAHFKSAGFAPADVARLISTGTGLLGGGDLSANRTLTPDVASQAEAEAGSSTAKLMTPQRTLQCINANVPLPIGAIFDLGMSTVPAKYLACNGQAVSRSTYAALFAAIGTTWGAGNGSTTFNVPDFTGRTRARFDASATRMSSFASIGTMRGSQTSPTSTLHAHGIAAGGTVWVGNSPGSETVQAMNDPTVTSSGGPSAPDIVQPTAAVETVIFAGA